MKNIAIVLPSLAYKGPIIVAYEIIKSLNNVFSIYVYYFDNIIEFDTNIKNVYFKRISFFDDIDFSRFDIIHSHMLRPDIFIFKNRKKIEGIKVTTIHNYIEYDLCNNYGTIMSFFVSKLWLYVLNKFDCIIVLSKHMRNYYALKIKNVDIKYIYNGRDFENKCKEEVSPKIVDFCNNSIVIGTIALLTKRKGIDQLVNAVALLKNYKLLVIGDGPELSNLKKLAKDLNVSERCFFSGFIPNAYKYVELFDIYAMVSHSEGFPISLIEAAAYAKATVCSNLGIFKEFFPNEVVYYNINNIKDLADSIEIVYKNRDFYSNEIFYKYRISYTGTIMAKNYRLLYKQLMRENR